MNPEKQRIAIAEACGWKRDEWTDTGPYPETYTGWSHPEHGFVQILPDYLSDLNAMHEAERVLRNEQFDRYRADLWMCVGNEDFAFESCAPLTAIRFFVSATAAQRAEAFLRTIGKWEES